MNQIQKFLCGSMLAILLGFMLYPEWTLTWTSRLDYRYYYEADLPAPGAAPAPGVWQEGSETERRRESRRHLIFPAPTPRPADLPPPKAELTGTGTVNLGRRHTVYTATSVETPVATINRRKMAWEAVVLLIPLGMFLVMFRTNARRRPAQPSREPPTFIS